MSISRVEAFFEGLSGDWIEFWAPVTAWTPNWEVWSAADTDLHLPLHFCARCAILEITEQGQYAVCKGLSYIFLRVGPVGFSRR